MSETTAHTDEQRDGLDAPSGYSPPPARTAGPRPAWMPAVDSRERRWWAAALVAIVVVGGTAVGLLYTDDSRNQATVRSMQTANESLTGRNEILNDQLKTTQTNLTATLGELAKTTAQLEHPQLVTWNSAVPIKDNMTYYASPIPDAFTFHLQATASGPVSVSILTLDQFVAARQCVNPGGGTTNYCMHHSGTIQSWLSQTSFNYDFHLAEGCADYLAVFTAASAVTLTPNISVTYNPASKATGVCA